MQYAEHLPRLSTPKTLVGPVVALALGAAAATGAYALLDDDGVVQPTATKVIVAEPPVQPGEGVGAKDEAVTAAAIGGVDVAPAAETKDEAGTAAALGQSDGTDLRGSKASDYGTSQYRSAQP